ncbi:lysostaphin resistance A-like protein [Pseudactinotalea sp. Z1732]|uniref:CPBP family intramembrane glutamic endopeptidase n=1 Tax=Micrococcales TaxID=85006 RepID=UPI003C7E95CA
MPTEAAIGTTRAPLVVRIGLVLATGVGIWALMSWLTANLYGGQLSIPVRLANAALISGLAIPMVILARRYLDRRAWSGIGLGVSARAWRPFLIGVVAFLVPSALGLGIALGAGWLSLQAHVPVAHILAWAVLLVVLVFFFEALPEELIFRGYLQRNLTTVMAPWLAAIAQAVLFTVFGTALWVASEGWGVLAERGIMFLAMAVVLGLLRTQTGSVWTPVGFHLAFQVVAQTVLSQRVGTDNEPGLMIAAIISAFVLGTTVVSLLHRTEANWSRPEPE